MTPAYFMTSTQPLSPALVGARYIVPVRCAAHRMSFPRLSGTGFSLSARIWRGGAGSARRNHDHSAPARRPPEHFSGAQAACGPHRPTRICRGTIHRARPVRRAPDVFSPSKWHRLSTGALQRPTPTSENTANRRPTRTCRGTIYRARPVRRAPDVFSASQWHRLSACDPHTPQTSALLPKKIQMKTHQ
jgi:hypothetical protein